MDVQSAHNREQSRTEFQHRPIDTSTRQIRLLTLLKDLTHDGLLQCMIHVADLSNRPRYQAISYVWGNEVPVRQIVLNGAVFAIRENLWQFLNMFRTKSDNNSFLWIDQISIDQLDILERSQQVQIMGTIFGQAARVVCWLGWPNPRHATVKAAIDKHKHDDDSGYRRRWQKCTMQLNCMGPQCPLCERHRLDRAEVQLSDILGSTYWTRLWITQEFVLAKDLALFLGYERLTKSDVLDYCTLLREGCKVDVVWRIEALLESRILKTTRGRYGLALHEGLSYIRLSGLQCADPRDLVYGLLGLIQTSDRITVNYDLHSSEVLSEILDKMIIAERKFSWRDEKVVNNMASLVHRLGMPSRWQTWLRSGDKSLSSVVSNLMDFYRCSDSLNEHGFLRARWPLEELASMISAACPSLYTPQQTRELAEYFNNMNFPLSLQQRLEPYLHSGGLLTKYSFPGPPDADFGNAELKRVMEYERLIVAILGPRTKEDMISMRIGLARTW